MLARIVVQACRSAIALRMLPELAAWTSDASGRASLNKVKRGIEVLVQRVKRRPEVSRKQVCDPALADQGRIGSGLIRQLVIVSPQIEHHLGRDRINRISGDAHAVAVTTVDRQKLLAGGIGLKQSRLELPVTK